MNRIKRNDKYEYQYNYHPFYFYIKVIVMIIIGTAFLLSPFIFSMVAIISITYHINYLLGCIFALVYIMKISSCVVRIKAKYSTSVIESMLDIPLEETHELSVIVSDIALKLGVKKPELIKITFDYNMSIELLPTFNKGRIKCELNLVCGLPYLIACNPVHLKGALAHELYHLKNDRYYLLYILDCVINELNKMRSTRQINRFSRRLHSQYCRLFTWYLKFALLNTRAASRVNEYRSDAASASIIGPIESARSLLSDYIYSNYFIYVQRPSLYRLANNHPTLPHESFKKMASAFKMPISFERLCRWLKWSLNDLTNSYSTHPSITDRIINLNISSQSADALPAVISECLLESGMEPQKVKLIQSIGISEINDLSAAEYIFGENFSSLCRQMEEVWILKYNNWWKNQYVYHQSRIEKLQQLELKVQNNVNYPVEQLRIAWIMKGLLGAEDAIPYYRAVLAKYPNQIVCMKNLGEILIDLDDPEGEVLLQKVMEREPYTIVNLSSKIIAYHTRNGRLEVAASVKRFFQSWHDIAGEMNRAIYNFTDDYQLQATAMSERDIRYLIQIIQDRVSEAEQIYLFRKNLEHLSVSPRDMIVVKITKDITSNIKTIQNELKDLECFPGFYTYFAKNTLTKKMLKSLKPDFLVWDIRTSIPSGKDLP